MVALKTFSIGLKSTSSRPSSPDLEAMKQQQLATVPPKAHGKFSGLLMGRSKSAMLAAERAKPQAAGTHDALKLLDGSGVPLTLTSSLDSSYIVTLEVRLTEAVQATLFGFSPTGVIYNGKPAPNFNNACVLARMISTELRVANSSHFLRAICRQVYKALTVLSTNLDSLFLTTTTEFSTLASVFADAPMKPKETASFRPGYLFAFEIAKVAWVVRSTIESAEDFVDDRVSKETLRLALDPLSATTARIANPVVVLIKTVFSNAFERIRTDEDVQSLSPAISLAVQSLSNSSTVSCKDIPVSSFTPRLSELSRKLDIAKRLMQALAVPCGPQGHTWIASCCVHIIWKAMTAYSIRRPDSIKVVTFAKKGADSGKITPSLQQQVRSPSPSLHHVSVALARTQMTSKSSKPTVVTKLAESMSSMEAGNALLSVEISLVENMILGFLKGLVDSSAIQQAKPPSVVAGDSSESSSDDDDELANLALGALKEALRALTAMVAVMPFLKSAPLVMDVLLVPFTESTNKPLRRAFSALPPVVLQHCVQARSNVAPVHQLLRMTWDQFSQTCIPSFATSQDWTSRIASALKTELIRNGGTFTPPSSSSPPPASPELSSEKAIATLDCDWSDVMILVLKKRGILE